MGVPRPTLGTRDLVAVIIGVVIGAGIFRTPSLVASNAGSEALAIFAWILGGAISLVGALCYAELAATYPDAGGDYHYLRRSFGQTVGFLFAWARLTVIQTGSIALQAFLVGDYASSVLRLGAHSSALYAAAAIALLTALNLLGMRRGRWIQNTLSAAIVAGLGVVIVVGLRAAFAGHGLADPPTSTPAGAGSFGLAMVFVLLTYGGWNEAAYLSAEVREEGRGIRRALLIGIAVITALYLLVNVALLAGLGLDRAVRSEAIVADLFRAALGPWAADGIALLVVVAALSTMNATIITGARSGYALGRDFGPLAWLGRWTDGRSTPAAALLAQAGIALLLVALGSATRQGFATMVEYTAPVFWLFFLLVGVSLFVLRRRDADLPRRGAVPLFPVTPLLFCGAAAYMLVSSVLHTGVGATVGLGVLLAGGVLLILFRRGDRGEGGGQ